MGVDGQCEICRGYTIDRFEFNQDERDLLNLAVDLDILDGVELGILMMNHGPNFDPINEKIIQYGYAHRHVDAEPWKEYVMAWENVQEGRGVIK